MKKLETATIDLSNIEPGLELYIDTKQENTPLYFADDAIDNNEAEIQLVEGFIYDYKFNKDSYYFEKNQIVQPHKRDKHTGTISPNIYVGTLTLPVFKNESETGKVYLEVQSVKADYREDYRDMLELITEKCTDLLMQANSPVSHHFDIDYSKDGQTLYQKFAFIKSIIQSEEFHDSIHKIVTSPVTQWAEESEKKDIRRIRRFSNSNIREFISGTNRTLLPENHYLRNYGLDSIPEKISSVRKIDTVDTPENRFVKHALEVFQKFISDINNKATNDTRLKNESYTLLNNIEELLNHSVFREVSQPTTLKLNSPVLQRKEGYREILRTWLMFDLAAKLVWHGGDDVYGAGKKDVATLYEYWLFFKLLDLLKSTFNIEPKSVSELIKETKDELNLQLKQGQHTALKGKYDSGNRKLNIRFNYNRSFSGKKKYPDSGSWTTTMRPDYTLSIWPDGVSEEKAEQQELIVHIHFDAKYKVANLNNYINSETDLDTEKEENRKGIYKNADLLKMHAYKDAIRRTAGAYVLYPGGKEVNRKGFHEIIPGLGAFPVKPSKTDDGISELKEFIMEVIKHFINRASQREKMAYNVFDTYKTNSSKDILKENIPEPRNENRDLIPSKTFVLIGYYKNSKHLKWILDSGIYNIRYGDNYIITPEMVKAKYILLVNSENENATFVKITSGGPKFYSKDELKSKFKYYNPKPNSDTYLVYETGTIEDEFKNYSFKCNLKKDWDFKPYAINLIELFKRHL